MHNFPWMSPYVAFDNNPVFYTDPYGLEASTGHDPMKTSPLKTGHVEPKGTELETVVVNADRIPSKWDKFWSDVQYVFVKAEEFRSRATGEIVLFGVSFINTVLSNNAGGAGRIKGDDLPFAVKAGRNTGDIISLTQGVLEIIAAGGMKGGGTALSTTGGGAVVGVPVVAAGTVIEAHGIALISITLSNMISDGVEKASSQESNTSGSSSAKGSEGDEAKTVGSIVKQDSKLLKFAKETFEGNDLLRKEANNLIEQLRKGNMNPGIGSKNIGKNIFEARSRGGARVYFRNVANGVEIVGYSNKANQQQVINRILEIY